MTKNQVKECLWWVLGAILTTVLLFLVAAMSHEAQAQTTQQAGRIDFVGRSLDKAVEIGPSGRASTYPGPAGSGTRFNYRTPDGKWHNTSIYGPRYDSRAKSTTESSSGKYRHHSKRR